MLARSAPPYFLFPSVFSPHSLYAIACMVWDLGMGPYQLFILQIPILFYNWCRWLSMRMCLGFILQHDYIILTTCELVL
jgi:hypothetical protein